MAYAVLKPLGLVGDVPVLGFVALVVGSLIISTVVDARWGQASTPRHLHARYLTGMACTTAVMYATGSGAHPDHRLYVRLCR